MVFDLTCTQARSWAGDAWPGIFSNSVCKIAAALVAAVEAAFAQGADTLLAKMAGLTACLHDRNNGVVL